MPRGLSQRTALLLVALAFGAAFAVRALPRSGSSTEPASKKGTAAGLAARDLRLAAAATVPALRQPRKPRTRTAEVVLTVGTPASVPSVQPVGTATVDPIPTVTAQPTAPRYVPPAPPPPRPSPTVAPPSGEFDTSGDGVDPGAP